MRCGIPNKLRVAVDPQDRTDKDSTGRARGDVWIKSGCEKQREKQERLLQPVATGSGEPEQHCGNINTVGVQ